jgi:hypothetical protein
MQRSRGDATACRISAPAVGVRKLTAIYEARPRLSRVLSQLDPCIVSRFYLVRQLKIAM